MKEIEDNRIKNIFGRLSDKEAEVDSFSWNKISEQLPHPTRGFWNGGLTHFNIFYAISAVVILIVVGVIVYSKMETTVLPSPAIPDPFGKTNHPLLIESEKTDSVNSYGLHKNTPVTTTSPFVDSGKRAVVKHHVLLPDSLQHTQDVYETKDKNFDNHSAVEENNRVSDSSTMTDSLLVSESILKDSLKMKTPISKKIIIFEEDTIIKIDTVYKNSRFRRGKNAAN